jgi:hypothetical protein
VKWNSKCSVKKIIKNGAVDGISVLESKLGGVAVVRLTFWLLVAGPWISAFRFWSPWATKAYRGSDRL